MLETKSFFYKAVLDGLVMDSQDDVTIYVHPIYVLYVGQSRNKRRY